MKSYHHYPIILFLLALFTTNLPGQTGVMRGQEGDICYEAEWAYVHPGDQYAGTLFQEYINCVAQHYREGNINLYEVRVRVGHGMELMKVFESLAWTQCINSSDDNCSSDYITYLFQLDSDKDGEEDIFDSTPFGGNEPQLDEVGDEDGDGVSDDMDDCPGTLAGLRVDAQGCPKLVIKAESVYPFYTLDDDHYTIIGRVMDPTETIGINAAAVKVFWYGGFATRYTDAEGAFELDLPALTDVPKTYEVKLTVTHEDYMMNSITITFGVRSELSVSVDTDKRHYLAGEVIQISGQVLSPEPIASDLDIHCEVEVQDQYGTNTQPYRVQRVHLRSDGTFSYEVPIYGPDEEGKWLESGEFGDWLVTATVEKDGETAKDRKGITVYRTQVDQNKATRAFWDWYQAQELEEEEIVQTEDDTPIYERPSHNEALIFGPKTEALFEASVELEQRIKVIEGTMLYLKDMHHELTKQKQVVDGMGGDYIIVQGRYVDCSSPFSAYILEVDPATQTDRLTVYSGPITVSSPEARFATFTVKNRSQVVVNAQGVQEQRSLSMMELREIGEPFEAALNGLNPAMLRHQSDPYAEELDPDYQPSLVEILMDYAWYIIAGLAALLLLILFFRNAGKRRSQPEVEAKPPAEDEWEATRFCTQCGNVMPQGSRFCPSCGVEQG